MEQKIKNIIRAQLFQKPSQNNCKIIIKTGHFILINVPGASFLRKFRRNFKKRLNVSSNIYLLRKHFKYRQKDLYNFYIESVENVTFLNYLKTQLRKAKNKAEVGGWIDFHLLPYIYSLVRIHKPKIVVETGVGPGGSSAFILNALEKMVLESCTR